MPDYTKGKIYKLTGASKTYIGSTTRPLSARHWEHKSKPLITTQEIIDDPTNQITLIELFPCSSKEELLARERYHIEQYECVNKTRPIITKDEYKIWKNNYNSKARQTDEYKEYRKIYRNSEEQKNKDKIYQQTPERRAYQKAYRERKKAEKLLLK